MIDELYIIEFGKSYLKKFIIKKSVDSKES